jgi:hypothetical protein
MTSFGQKGYEICRDINNRKELMLDRSKKRRLTKMPLEHFNNYKKYLVCSGTI